MIRLRATRLLWLLLAASLVGGQLAGSLHALSHWIELARPAAQAAPEDGLPGSAGHVCLDCIGFLALDHAVAAPRVEFAPLPLVFGAIHHLAAPAASIFVLLPRNRGPPASRN